MLFMIFMQYVAFPQKTNAIFANTKNTNDIEVESSGSIGIYDGKKCVQTHPNNTLVQSETQEWCSNIAKQGHGKPWVTYSLRGKKMSLTGYSIRNGCCYYGCCCIDDNDFVPECCCELYSFSLVGSNDNSTWEKIHVVKDDGVSFRYCEFKTYEFAQTKSYKYIRIVQDAPHPGCTFCMVINQVEFYGTTDGYEAQLDDESDETVSIIGKVRSI